MIAAVVVWAACSAVSAVGDEFPRATITVSGEPWEVAVADSPELRRRGLQGVEGLGDLDGMLFVFPEPTEAAFTMRGTRMAIDIAFFAEDGVLVDRLEMVPCRGEPCPSYRSSGPFRYAVETQAGGFSSVEPPRLDPASLPGAGG